MPLHQAPKSSEGEADILAFQFTLLVKARKPGGPQEDIAFPVRQI